MHLGPCERAMGQVVATLGFEMQVQLDEVNRVGAANAVIRQTRRLDAHELASAERLIGRYVELVSVARSIRRICRALPPADRRRLLADLHAGRRAAQPGRMSS